MSRAAIVTVTGLVAAIAATGLAWSAAAALQQDEPEVRRGQSVTICHANGNGNYVQNSPDADSIVSGEGHGGHPEDIIPPFDYPPSGQDEGGHYPGKNWNPQNEAIWKNGCKTPDPPPPGTLRVRKVVVPETAASPNEFSFIVNGQTIPFADGGENQVPLPPGTYDVTEVDAPGFTTTRDNCSGITVVSSQQTPVCTITNTAEASSTATLKVRKVVVPETAASPNEFSFIVNGQTIPFADGGENQVPLPPGTYDVTEVDAPGFTATFQGCSDIELETSQLTDPVCTITNTAESAQVAKLIVRKKVVDSDRPASAFSFTVDGKTTPFEEDGENEVSLQPGTYDVDEVREPGFTTILQGCSDIELTVPQQTPPVCTITNTADEPSPHPFIRSASSSSAWTSWPTAASPRRSATTAKTRPGSRFRSARTTR